MEDTQIKGAPLPYDFLHTNYNPYAKMSMSEMDDSTYKGLS